MKPIYQITVPQDCSEDKLVDIRDKNIQLKGRDYHIEVIRGNVEFIETKVLGDSFTKELYEAKHTLDNLISFYIKKHKELPCMGMPITMNEDVERQYGLQLGETLVYSLFMAIDDYFDKIKILYNESNRSK